MKDIVLVPTPAPGLGSPQGAVAGAHFFLQDRSGKSLVVEPVDGTLKVHDAPLGVMTNAPTYDWHMTNLVNYINLSVKDVDSAKVGDVTLSAFGSGAGLLGLPGDFTPPSRFVRAVAFSQSAAPNATRRRRGVRGLPYPQPVRHPQGRGGELGDRPAYRRDHRMDQRRRPQESRAGTSAPSRISRSAWSISKRRSPPPRERFRPSRWRTPSSTIANVSATVTSIKQAAN